MTQHKKDDLTGVPEKRYTVSVLELIAYKGEKFQIEWYLDPEGGSDTRDYFLNLDERLQAKAIALFKRMAETGEIKDKTKFRNEGNQIFAFKPMPHRFLCFFVKGRKIILTNAFYKKQDKLPKNEKDRAEKRKADYEKRTKNKTYYPDDL